MKLSIIFFCIFSASFAVFAQNSDLPSAAQELVTKLETWEAQQRASLEKEIEEKRVQVSEALNAQLEQATKDGDLDGALAIRTYMNSLRKGSATVEMERPAVEQANPGSAGSDDPQIPRDAHRYRKSYFKVFSVGEAIAWTDAMKKCEEMGGRLVSVESEEKWKKIRDYLSGFEDASLRSQLWLGSSRKDANSPFVWSNGEEMEFSLIYDHLEQRARFEKSSFSYISIMLADTNTWAYKQNEDPLVKGYICEWEKR